jgi:hypothetical protein
MPLPPLPPRAEKKLERTIQLELLPCPPVPMDLTQVDDAPRCYNVYAKRARVAGLLLRSPGSFGDDDETDRSLPFSTFVSLPKTADYGNNTEKKLPYLAMELKLAIVAQCEDSPSTLWALMHTSSGLRQDAQRLFWSSPDIWYLHDGDLDCVCCTTKLCDPRVRRFAQQLVFPVEPKRGITPEEAKVWWTRMKRGFPAVKRVWIIGRNWAVRPLVSAWKSMPDTAAIDLVQSSSHAEPKVWKREGTQSVGNSSNWKVVHLPEPDSALRTFRGSDDKIEQLLTKRNQQSTRSAELYMTLRMFLTPMVLHRTIATIIDNHKSIVKLDAAILALRRRRNDWGERSSPEWKEWERRFWAVLSADALLCANTVEECRAARRLSLETGG